MNRLIILILIIIVSTGCASEPIYYEMSDSARQVIETTITTNITNDKVDTIFIETPMKGDTDTTEDYSIPIAEWISDNRNKRISNITNYPAQGGIEGVFITFSEEDNYTNDYKLFVERLDTDKSQDTIDLVINRLSINNIVTATTVNGWRGGIDFVIIIYE